MTPCLPWSLRAATLSPAACSEVVGLNGAQSESRQKELGPMITQTGTVAERIDQPVLGELHRPQHTLVVLTAFCAVLGLTQLLILESAEWDLWPMVLWESTLVLYFASGLIALWRQPHNSFGTLLILAGLGQWCAGMETVPLLGLSTIGHLTKTLPLALMIHVILAFPNGRLPSQLARVTVIMAYLTSTLLEIPNMLLDEESPMRLPGPGSADLLGFCTTVQRVAGLVCLLLTMTVLWKRWISGKAELKGRLTPFILYAFTCLIGVAITGLTRLLGALSINGPDILQKIPQLQVVLIAFLPIVFLVGVLTGSFGRAGELREFLDDVGGRSLSSNELDEAVARAVGIPGSRVVYATDGAGDFVDSDGSTTPNELVSENLYPIRYHNELVGAIAYRPTPGMDSGMLEAVAEASALVISHQQTLASLNAALLDLRRTDRALRQSRRRIALAGDRERRRIARDLHDGLQQSAIALGLRAEQLKSERQDPVAVAASATAVRDGVVALLAELRNLIQGIMPAPLVERGVFSAVRALSGQFPVPLDIEVQGSPRRLSAEIESTIYFCILEAITNAAKHANASVVGVRLTATKDQVTAAISDDGTGGAMVGAGSGLIGLRDRLAAFGGTLDVASEPGFGTQVRMAIPCG